MISLRDKGATIYFLFTEECFHQTYFLFQKKKKKVQNKIEMKRKRKSKDKVILKRRNCQDCWWRAKNMKTMI